MNGKTRVLTAVNLAEPDRVPMDFHANPWVLQRLHGDQGTTTHRDSLSRLHSGICTQYLLPNGTPDEVRVEVRRRVEISGAGGGYILTPCHVLQTDVPTENVLAMSDAGLEACRAAELESPAEGDAP